MKLPQILFTFIAAAVSASAAPSIVSVVGRQQWPWSPEVTVDYALTGMDGPCAISLEAYSGSTLLCTIPFTAFSLLSGDTAPTADGSYRVTFNPVAIPALRSRGVLADFHVKARVGEIPLYVVIDLAKDKGADGKVTYITASQLGAGTYGTTETNKWAENGVAAGGIIWTGFTNDQAYASTKLVLRYCPRGSFKMGSTALETGHRDNELQHQVSLTKGFYMSVYPVTAAQYKQITGDSPSDAGNTPSLLCPVNLVPYETVRGKRESGISWPVSGTNVVADSFLGKLRDSTGLCLDLPTEAQWEYACRATVTDGHWNSGLAILGTGTDANLAELAWYSGDTSAAQPVGGKKANSWGLYDMQGGVLEWCLDWMSDSSYTSDHSGVRGYDGPDSAVSGDFRALRGGCWVQGASDCRPAARAYFGPSSGAYFIGFRLCMTLL